MSYSIRFISKPNCPYSSLKHSCVGIWQYYVLNVENFILENQKGYCDICDVWFQATPGDNLVSISPYSLSDIKKYPGLLFGIDVDIFGNAINHDGLNFSASSLSLSGIWKNAKLTKEPCDGSYQAYIQCKTCGMSLAEYDACKEIAIANLQIKMIQHEQSHMEWSEEQKAKYAGFSSVSEMQKSLDNN